MIRLLMADDHALMREGIKQLLALSQDIEVAGEAEDGDQVMRLMRKDRFDLVLLDLSMPSVCGADLVAWIHDHYPTVPILVLSMHNEPQVVERALQAGALGYMTKDNAPNSLMEAIRTVAAGGQVIDHRLAEQLAFKHRVANTVPYHLRLTDRELNIMQMLVRGMSINKIAEQLRISNKTVSTHKARLMEKMNIHNNAELVRYAVFHGMVV